MRAVGGESEKVEVDLCIQGRVRLACDVRNPIPRGYLLHLPPQRTGLTASL